jgi:restriction system protein
MAEKKDIPSVATLGDAIVKALATLGGEASNDQLSEEVVKSLGLSSVLLTLKHDASRGNRTEFEYRMAWARTKLKEVGKLERAGAKRWRVRS